MVHTSSIKLIMLFTLCLGLMAGGQVAHAKKSGGLIFTEKMGTANTFTDSTAQLIDIGAPGGDPATITVKTKKKKGQTVAVWFNAECNWDSGANGNEFIGTRILVDGIPIAGTVQFFQCASKGSATDVHVAHLQGAVTLARGTHTIQVRVTPVFPSGPSGTLRISDISVIVLVQ